MDDFEPPFPSKPLARSTLTSGGRIRRVLPGSESALDLGGAPQLDFSMFALYSPSKHGAIPLL